MYYNSFSWYRKRKKRILSSIFNNMKNNSADERFWFSTLKSIIKMFTECVDMVLDIVSVNPYSNLVTVICKVLVKSYTMISEPLGSKFSKIDSRRRNANIFKWREHLWCWCNWCLHKIKVLITYCTCFSC